jgi:hypothetical protein
MSDAVPRRTPAGDEALARHAAELDTSARVVLAAVDGKRTVAILKARFGALMPVEAVLDRLLRGGFLEIPGAAAPAPPVASVAVPAAAAPAAPAAPAFDLAVARRMAVRALTETLGPGGDMLALQIERSKTPGEFAALHAKALGVVRAQRGDDAVAAFLQWSPAPPPA